MNQIKNEWRRNSTAIVADVLIVTLLGAAKFAVVVSMGGVR